MPATSYKVWAWGTPVGVGVTGASYVGVAGVAKKATTSDPFIVANEVVCNALARMLLLPCPPGATLDKGGEPYFFSLDFNLVGAALPPADPVQVVALFPRLAWGIVLFDSLVMNDDRHDRNIAHDTSTHRLQIFDHSHAFLRAGTGNINDILANADGKLCIGNHCLAQEMFAIDGLSIWAHKIAQIPDFFIEGITESATTVGLPAAHKQDCIDFMKKRRSEIGTVAYNQIDQFPKLAKASKVTP